MPLSNLTFEVFPTKLETPIIEQLNRFSPEYFSLTCGTGGAKPELTEQMTAQLMNEFQINIAPHVTCAGMTKNKVERLLEYYPFLGVERVVVLRGDSPANIASSDFTYAADLVEFIRTYSKSALNITVAVYPELDPKTQHGQRELQYFKAKVEAGADCAITQYFYDADHYARLLDACQKLNINIPIIPGIMPITNYQELVRFSKICHVNLPESLQQKFTAADDDCTIGLAIVSQLCERLLQLGAPGLHFYTLNKVKPTRDILSSLGFEEQE
jgi:methylenetetrahydrofolate reductase (NADPH)